MMASGSWGCVHARVCMHVQGKGPQIPCNQLPGTLCTFRLVVRGARTHMPRDTWGTSHRSTWLGMWPASCAQAPATKGQALETREGVGRAPSPSNSPSFRGSGTCWRDSRERKGRTDQAGDSSARGPGREGKFLENQPTGKGTFPSDDQWTALRVPPVGLLGSVSPVSPAPNPCTHILLASVSLATAAQVPAPPPCICSHTRRAEQVPIPVQGTLGPLHHAGKSSQAPGGAQAERQAHGLGTQL